MERWGKLLFPMTNGFGVDWRNSFRQVARQDDVLQTAVRPILEGREWFFRRRDLPHENAPEYNDSIFIFLKLTEGEHDARQALAVLRRSLEGWDHAVLETTEWDGNPGHGDSYDHDSEANSDWRAFCCRVADAYLGSRDLATARQAARQVAARWHIGSSPMGERLVHWLCWITGDPDEVARRTQFGVT